MSSKICTISDCGRPHYGHGWCNTHYMRWRRNGDPNIARARAWDPEASFLAHTQRRGDCLIWTGYKSSGGYGRLSMGKKKVVQAHRYAWERTHGPIPEGVVIDHLCHTPLCVEVSHLRTATPAENGQHRSGAQRNSGTGIRNVYRRGNRFLVQIKRGGTAFYLGTFDTAEEAAAVADSGRREHFGAFAGNGGQG